MNIALYYGMNTNNLLHSFKNAWDMLLDIPLPLKLEAATDDDEVQDNLLVCFPVVGAVLGLTAFLAAYVLGLLLPIRIASAVIVSVVLALGTELVASSSNISLLTSFIKAAISKPNEQNPNSIDSNAPLDNPLSLMLFLSLYLLKLFCIGLLIYHAKTSWIIVTFTLSYLVRSQLATEPLIGSSTPLIEMDNKNSTTKRPWLVASAIVLFTGISYLPAAIISLLVAFALIAGFRKYSLTLGGVSSTMIGVYGVAAELIFLFAGVAIVIR